MTDNAPVLRPRKTPRQGRSAATCDAILQAAARILEQGGLEALTTNLVAERAGVSIGSLYQYYPSKEVILAELIRDMRAGMLSDLEQAVAQIADFSLAQTVDHLLAASMQHHVAQPVLARALEQAEDALPLNEEVSALKAQINALVGDVLRQAGVADATVAAKDISALASGIMDAAISADERDFDALRGRIGRAVLGYLGQPISP